MDTGLYAHSEVVSEAQPGWTQADHIGAYPPNVDEVTAAYPPSQAMGTAESGAWPTETIGAPPGLPPASGDGPDNGRSGRRRIPWKYGLAAFVLLAALAGGIGIGRVAFGTSTSQVVIGAPSAPAISGSSSASNVQQTLENVARAVEPSVVEITSIGNGQEAIGSGDIITTNGYIVTNDHVVDGYSSYTVTLQNGTQLQAHLVGEDPQEDLAVVKVSANNLQAISFADSSKVTVGEFAVAVGNPYGQRETATFGTVTATNRTESESPDGPATVLTGLIQASAPIAPGNSGGALVNLQGQLIGIPTLGESSQQTGSTTTIGFAIPSNEVKTVAQQLIQNGHVASAAQGFLGIAGEDVTPGLAAANGLSVQSGVLVAGFANDTAGQSPAAQAGLQTGDVIIAVNGQSIGDRTDLAAAVATQKPGTQVSVTVVRGSSQLTIKLTLGARP
jgi:S1-C subfamily serine protease